MKFKKTLIAVAAICAGLAVWKVSEKPEEKTVAKLNQNLYSENEVSPDEALAIVSEVELKQDFTTFVYRCDKVRKVIVLIERPQSAPRPRLVLAMNEGEVSAKRRFVPDAQSWSYTDNNGTDWNIEAGQVTGHSGSYDGTVCKFDLDESTVVKQASKHENIVSRFGV